jgi:hypothetical protein
MAEITRVRTVKTHETVYRGREGTEDTKLTERVRVASLKGKGLDVGTIFDLAHALEHAGITRGGVVTGLRDEAGHLTQLIVEAEVAVEEEPSPAAGAGVA